MTDVFERDTEWLDRVLDVRDVALFLRISESIVRRLIKERRIPFFQIEGRYLFYRPAVEEWIRHSMIEPTNSSQQITEALTTTVWTKRKDS